MTISEISPPVDPTSRESIAAARARCITEIGATRDAIRALANGNLTPTTLDTLAKAVERMNLLHSRVVELKSMAAAAYMVRGDK